jgi:hypothetical protein
MTGPSRTIPIKKGAKQPVARNQLRLFREDGVIKPFLLVLMVTLGIVEAQTLHTLWAATQQGGPPKTEDRISGTVQRIDAATKTITIQNKGRSSREVLYSNNTKFTSGDKPTKADAVKIGRTLVCVGSLDKGKFVARWCTVQ